MNIISSNQYNYMSNSIILYNIINSIVVDYSCCSINNYNINQGNSYNQYVLLH